METNIIEATKKRRRNELTPLGDNSKIAERAIHYALTTTINMFLEDLDKISSDYKYKIQITKEILDQRDLHKQYGKPIKK